MTTQLQTYQNQRFQQPTFQLAQYASNCATLEARSSDPKNRKILQKEVEDATEELCRSIQRDQGQYMQA